MLISVCGLDILNCTMCIDFRLPILWSFVYSDDTLCNCMLTGNTNFVPSAGCKCALTPVLGSPSDWPESSLLPEDNHAVDRDRRSAAIRAPFASSNHLHSNTCPANLAMVAYDADCTAGIRNVLTLQYYNVPSQLMSPLS
jgi:hypothetical protein